MNIEELDLGEYETGLFEEVRLYEDVSSEDVIDFLERTENNKSCFEYDGGSSEGDVMNPGELVRAMNDAHVERPLWDIEVIHSALPWRSTVYRAHAEYENEGSDFEADDANHLDFLKSYDAAGYSESEFTRKGEIGFMGTVVDESVVEELEN